MNDIEKRDEIPSTSTLTKLGLTAIGYSAGGIFLFILQVVSRFRVFGLIAGAIVCLLGIGSLLSKDPADRKAGIIITTAGVLAVLSKSGIPGIMQVTGTLLVIGAVGLLALGIWSGIKFFIGLKKRS